MAGYIKEPKAGYEGLDNRGPKTEEDAFRWLLKNAAFEPRLKNTPGGVVDLQPGEIMVSKRQLASVFEWNVDKVTRFINKLERLGHVSKSAKERDAKGTLLKIIDFQRYQGSGTKKAASAMTPARQPVIAPERAHPAAKGSVVSSVCSKRENLRVVSGSGTVGGTGPASAIQPATNSETEPDIKNEEIEKKEEEGLMRFVRSDPQKGFSLSHEAMQWAQRRSHYDYGFIEGLRKDFYATYPGDHYFDPEQYAQEWKDFITRDLREHEMDPYCEASW